MDAAESTPYRGKPRQPFTQAGEGLAWLEAPSRGPSLNHPDCDLQLSQRPLDGAGSVTFRLYADHPTHRRLNRADDEICVQAQALGVLGEQPGLPTPPVVVVTMDSGMVGRAHLAGLRGLLLERPEDPWKVTDHSWPAPNAPSQAVPPD